MRIGLRDRELRNLLRLTASAIPTSEFELVWGKSRYSESRSIVLSLSILILIHENLKFRQPVYMLVHESVHYKLTSHVLVSCHMQLNLVFP